MALQLDTIRAAADRVAASHHLEVVELDFSGGAKHRTLRVFIEKDKPTRAALIELARAAESGAPLDPTEPLPNLPSGVPAEQLSGVTHEDCSAFTHDFGTLLDIEDLIPGAEYTLEVSSPGLERKLSKPADYTRFLGSLAKLQTFTAIDANRHFQGRLTAFDGTTLTLDPAAIKQKGKGKKSPAPEPVTIPLRQHRKSYPHSRNLSLFPAIGFTMASPLYQSIEALSREKGIEPAVVVSAIEDAIALATRKYYKTTENYARRKWTRIPAKIRAYVYKTVVETPDLVTDEAKRTHPRRRPRNGSRSRGRRRTPLLQKDTSPLGRIAAQMAKQVIFQKVREAERDTVYNEYNHRAGEVLNAIVKRLEPMDIIFDIGKTEARMPKGASSPAWSRFAVGERVRVVLLRVDRCRQRPPGHRLPRRPRPRPEPLSI